MMSDQVTHSTKDLECGILFYVFEIEAKDQASSSDLLILTAEVLYLQWKTSSKTQLQNNHHLVHSALQTLILYASILENNFLKADGLCL